MWFDNRGGRSFDVEAGEQAMGSQLQVLSEAEAAVLVARQPSSASSIANLTSSSSSLIYDSSPSLQLQQPPFRLKGANKGMQLLRLTLTALAHATAEVEWERGIS